MKLYISPFSSNARKATVTAHLLGLDVEQVPVDLAARAQYQPDYVALNPNAKVPTLVDGDITLWESNAIMIYLTDKVPGQKLYPSAPVPRAEVNRWLFWGAAHWTPQIGVLNFENMIKRMVKLGDPDPAKIAAATVEIERLATIADTHLATHRYLAGDALTLADVAIACPLMSTIPAKLPVARFTNLQSWFGRIQALDAWKATNPPAL